MRNFFHLLRSDRTLRDPEGSEHNNLDGVRLEAVDAARELMASAVRSGRDISDWAIEIADDGDVPLGHVAFTSVVTRNGRPSAR